MNDGDAHQQNQRAHAEAVRQPSFQRVLEPTHRDEVGQLHVQLRQPQKAINQTQPLAQRQVQVDLDT